MALNVFLLARCCNDWWQSLQRRDIERFASLTRRALCWRFMNLLYTRDNGESYARIHIC